MHFENPHIMIMREYLRLNTLTEDGYLYWNPAREMAEALKLTEMQTTDNPRSIRSFRNSQTCRQMI